MSQMDHFSEFCLLVPCLHLECMLALSLLFSKRGQTGMGSFSVLDKNVFNQEDVYRAFLDVPNQCGAAPIIFWGRSHISNENGLLIVRYHLYSRRS